MSKIKIYRVGGSVRDQLINEIHNKNIASKDIDYSVEASSYDDMKSEILRQNGVIFLESPQHYTIRALVNKRAADYVLCRKDGPYTDKRRPDYVTMGTIYDDLARRDFRMNSIAIDGESRERIDPYNGQADIKNQVISATGNAYDRLNEDTLRAFRAVRFAVQLGFSINPELNEAIHSLGTNDFNAVSTERVRDELFKMFRVKTEISFTLIFIQYPVLGKVVVERDIWFLPTSETRKRKFV